MEAWIQDKTSRALWSSMLHTLKTEGAEVAPLLQTAVLLRSRIDRELSQSWIPIGRLYRSRLQVEWKQMPTQLTIPLTSTISPTKLKRKTFSLLKAAQEMIKRFKKSSHLHVNSFLKLNK